MDSLRLIAAMCWIKKHMLLLEQEVVGIQFEDGSGNKFNYQTNRDNHWRFIDLTGKI